MIEYEAEIQNCAKGLIAGDNRTSAGGATGQQAFACWWRTDGGELSAEACNAAYYWRIEAGDSAVLSRFSTSRRNALRHFMWSAFIGYEVSVADTLSATGIHEDYGQSCPGTPRECKWDREADEHNNREGAEAGDRASGKFGFRGLCSDSGSHPPSGCGGAFNYGGLVGFVRLIGKTYLFFGNLDTRGGCPSRHMTIDQGC